MVKHLRLARETGADAAISLLATSIGLAGMFQAGRALSELLWIFECSGAVGGPPNPTRPNHGGQHARRN